MKDILVNRLDYILQLKNSLEILEILLYGEFKINPHYKTHNDKKNSDIRI